MVEEPNSSSHSKNVKRVKFPSLITGNLVYMGMKIQANENAEKVVYNLAP